MKRLIDKHLINWKTGKKRKSLLLRGARQVGKTYSIRELGKSFEHYCEVNFEEHPAASEMFKQSRDPDELMKKLSVYFEKPIVEGKTLLFLDEIQACPDALRSLRFFNEKNPGLHVAAAGSLLEFAIEEIPSFGVGRIESIFMYPLSFFEYLEAAGHKIMLEAIMEASYDKPLNDQTHRKLMEELRLFILTGGMPEAVEVFIEASDFSQSKKVLDAILISIIDDFAKYRKRTPLARLVEVFKSIGIQAGHKFKYSNVSEDKSIVIKDALLMLIKAGLAYQVIHTSAGGVPLGAQIDPAKFKVIMFDTGLQLKQLGLKMSDLISEDMNTFVNKGGLAEQFVGTELVKAISISSHPELYYWHRESKSSNAEVDYVIENNNGIIPVEVKSGTKGSMQSMRLFLNERKLSRGFRISSEGFGRYENIIVVPLYAAGRLYEL